MGVKVWILAMVLVLITISGCSEEQALLEENVSSLNNLGFYYAAQGENSKAKEFFNKVLEIDLSHQTARKNLALIYFEEENYSEAIKHFTFLTQLNPGDAQYHYDLAISISERCRVDNICNLTRAIEEFRIADQLEPGFEMATENVEALASIMKTLNQSEAGSQE